MRMVVRIKVVPTENPDFKKQWIFRTSRQLEPKAVLSLTTSVDLSDFSNEIFVSFGGSRNRDPTHCSLRLVQ